MTTHEIEMEADAVLAEVRRLLLQATYGFLATVRDGRPVARLCEHLAVDDDLTTWVGTSRTSRKVEEIAAHPEVLYATEDRGDLGYAAVTGRATVDASPERARALWRPHLVRFFPAGPDGPDADFILVRIDVDRAETMSFGAGLHPEPLGLRSVHLERGADRWRIADAT